MPNTNSRISAKRVLSNAVRNVSRDVIVISNDRGGDFYLATSMPTRSSQDFTAQIALVEEALKRLRRYRTNEQRREKANEERKELPAGQQARKGRRADAQGRQGRTAEAVPAA